MARYRFSFWLDAAKDDELLIAETIDELKAHRKFSWVVRTGIRIVTDLMQGRVDSLIDAFPWIVDAIAEMQPTPAPAVTLTEEEWAVLRQLATAQPAEMLPQQTSQSAGLGNGFVPQLPRTVDDDDDFAELLTITETEGQRGVEGTIFDVRNMEYMLENWDKGKNHTADANELALKNLRQH